jgi:hypothetical protein
MPRPAKASRRQKINAGIAYKKGERKEAYDLWRKADQAVKDRAAAKRNKHKKAGEGAS